jgi:hypothetical protein
MRALLLVLVLGSLLWLGYRSFRTVKAGNSETAEPAGFLIPAASNAPAPTPAATPPIPAAAPAAPPAARTPVDPVAAAPTKPVETPHASAASQSPRPSPPPSTPSPSSTPAAPTLRGSNPTGSPATGDAGTEEVAAASVLFHRTRELPAFLEGPGKSLPKGRKDLALALHRMLLGPIEEGRRMAEELEGADGVRVSEAAYVKQNLTGTTTAAAPARGESPLLLAASLARMAADAETALATGKSREAALAYGQLILAEVQAPWRAERESLNAWSDALAKSETGYRWNPAGAWPSVDVKVEGGDSLISVRKRALKDHPELLVCTGQIERANGVRGETIHPGQTLRIPTARASVLVDLDAHWALYRLGNEVVCAWEVGVGKPGSETPPGEYVVGEKTKEPPWFRPGHAPVPYGDPENPLGSRWIAWMKPEGGATSLGFHGTKDPASIGEDQSQGCVRMRQAAIEELFEILPKGATVSVQP